MELSIFDKHIEGIQQKSCNYGLITYTYNDGKKDTDYYSPILCNIGDYIQSLAALQYLPAVDIFCDRDQLGSCPSNVRMIMNGWYSIWKKNEVFSENIDPLMISIHLNNTDCISQNTLDHFKKHEPIGCRDIATRDFLLKNGIEAYFSGCLTLTLGRSYRIEPENRRGGIYFVDYEMGRPENHAMDDCISRILDKYKNEARYSITHDCPITMHPWEKLRSAECLVHAYANASLVITSRIHCALPCLGLGVPVILVCKEFDEKRFQGLFSFFNYLGYDKDHNLINTILTNKQEKVINRNSHEIYASRLQRIAEKFCNSSNVKFNGINDNRIQFNDLLRLENYIFMFSSRSITNNFEQSMRLDYIQKDMSNGLLYLDERMTNSINYIKDIIEKKCSDIEKVTHTHKQIIYQLIRNKIKIKIFIYSMLELITFGITRRRFSNKKECYISLQNEMKKG